jgi:hypothetical protein
MREQVETDHFWCRVVVEFATIRLDNDEVQYHLYTPAEIDTLLKKQNVGDELHDQQPKP